MVVRLDAGRDEVRAYVAEQAARGVDHVRSRIQADNEGVLALIGDLSEEEGRAVTPADEWSAFDVLSHLAGSLERSKTRIETLAAGRPYVNPPTAPGQQAAMQFASFDALRRYYEEGVAAVLGAIEAAGPARGLDGTAEHGLLGPFNWLQWAVYSHHVHTHDHVGQLEKIRAAIEARRERRERMRTYVKEQAAQGPSHVLGLAKAEWQRFEGLISGLTETEAAAHPIPEEWSIKQVVEHLTYSHERNLERIAAMSRGESFRGPLTQAGSLPERFQASFADTRRVFLDLVAEAARLIQAAQPGAHLDLTADHAFFGPYNWLDWAVHMHVHVRDHAGQVEKIRAALKT
jgi:hypothetical protein